MMKTDTTKAIVLRSIPFKDNQRILTLFSESLGLVSMIVKGLSPKKAFLSSLTEPLCEAEWVYVKGTSDLLKFHDGSILNMHLVLREQYSYLQTAMEMSQAILQTQLPEKSSPQLYALFSSFLKQVSHFSSPSNLLASFYLKLLKHEGLFNTDSPYSFSSDLHSEWDLIKSLISVQSYQQLKEIPVPASLLQKIKSAFLQKTKLHS